ncbi:MAG: 16S rRNA (uracil(1498)-N(3))-methyltransferase [Okeania sp. SIO3I5]|uniref:16S rRNA (uracil(1498)-N(3))-methyltransferase n=1 Tax=Okeania sp. SIO3I5 TaxID=2607805 RepID=UPI0013B9A4FE|nr:16S rRNA (uracil(1498)-N(3))-methyltransferase [Okeania sp. SIO3I5]NEQ35603.1 16S rRNA (uracil(1498)-N(3))-methyltransferase [Okeania sp. SIO3I5]
MADLQRLAIASHQINREKVFLTVEQDHYLRRVLRLEVGEKFIVMDGEGKWWLAKLTLDISGKTGLTAVLEQEILIQNELPIKVILICALPKGNNFDEVVRQSTELGVTQILPVISSRTLLQPSPQKLKRWHKIATEAAEQSERQVVPKIRETVEYSVALSLFENENLSTNYHKYICVARNSYPLLLESLLDNSKLESIVIATGPEGGWTDGEIEAAIATGFQVVSLGKRILRAVTAPIVALSLVAAILERSRGVGE